MKAKRAWDRIPAEQKRQLLEKAGQQANKHGPTVTNAVRDRRPSSPATVSASHAPGGRRSSSGTRGTRRAARETSSSRCATASRSAGSPASVRCQLDVADRVRADRVDARTRRSFPTRTPASRRDVHRDGARRRRPLLRLAARARARPRARRRREGMQIEGITLWLFGGVARFRGMFPSAGAEFRIAIAGPLVSLVLGGRSRSRPARAAAGRRRRRRRVARLHQPLAARLQPAAGPAARRRARASLGAVAARGRLRLGDARRRARRARVRLLFIAGGDRAVRLRQGAFGGVWLAFVGWFLLQAAQR